MDILDIHTHNLNNIHSGIYSHSLLDGDIPKDVKYWSASIHPWFLNENNVSTQIELLKEALSDSRLVAIGEVGLDKLSNTSFKLQIETFKQISNIAEQNNKPLIIHAVKSSNEILQIHKELNPSNPWIIHGFRGKEKLAEEYIRHGLYLSFGEKFNNNTISNIPLDRIFIETDESQMNINDILKQAASACKLSENQFQEAIRANINKVFFK